ncbi:hypothetical protein V6N13_083099 [Hibiscus sabdariffa]
MYTAKSYLASIVPDSGPKDEIWQHFWSGFAAPNVMAFLWKAFHGRLPTKVNLLNRGCLQNQTNQCPLCEVSPETVDHLLCQCKMTWLIIQRWCHYWGINLIFLASEVAANSVLLAPAKGELKFNVDGVVTGSFGEAGQSPQQTTEHVDLEICFGKALFTEAHNLQSCFYVDFMDVSDVKSMFARTYGFILRSSNGPAVILLPRWFSMIGNSA